MSDLKAEYEKLVAGMNPQGYIYRYADGIREGTNGRSINGGYPLETIRYYLAPAIVELLLSERRKVLDRMSTDPHPPTDVLAPLREKIRNWTAVNALPPISDRDDSLRVMLKSCIVDLEVLLPALETAIAERVASQSDGHHTFTELYEHRHALFSVICSHFVGWKSKLHPDGSMFDGWFIAGVPTPKGQATYHLPLSWWDRFNCEELEYAPNWDGHTPNDVIERIASLGEPR